MAERSDNLVAKSENLVAGSGNLVARSENFGTSSDGLAEESGNLVARSENFASESGEFFSQKTITLTRAISASGERYVDETGKIEFWLKGEEASLSFYFDDGSEVLVKLSRI